MSDPLEFFLGKFREIWRDGKDARITVECHAGQAWVSLHHRLPCPPPLSPQQPRSRSQPSTPRQPWKPGPSRLRRRARREEARRACYAAENAANVVRSEQNTNVTENITESDTAVQAEQLPEQEIVNVAAEQAGQPLLAAEQALHQPLTLNVEARPWPHCDGNVKDVFCPDHQYLQQQQLQLPQAPRNQCNVCGKTFGSERALCNHMDRDHM